MSLVESPNIAKYHDINFTMFKKQKHKPPPPQCYDKPVWTLRELLQIITTIPGHLKKVIPTQWNRPISSQLRERIMLAVASENRCVYCQTAHSVFGEGVGLKPADMRSIISGIDVSDDEGEKLALQYARDLARRQFKSLDESMYSGLDKYFSDKEKEAIHSSAHLMNFANRFGNTFDAATIRFRNGRNCTPATLLDQVVVSILFVLGASSVIPMLASVKIRSHLKPKKKWSNILLVLLVLPLLACSLKTRTPSLASEHPATSFELANHEGKVFTVDDLVRDGSGIIIFYRGYW